MIRDAKELAARHQESAGVTGINDHTAAQVLDTVRVRLFADREWENALAPRTIGGGDPAMAEAITTTQRNRGSRSVYVDNGDSTLPALVHEISHALSANGLDGLWNGLAGELVEGHHRVPDHPRHRRRRPLHACRRAASTPTRSASYDSP